MHALFTGASSFTGAAFVAALAECGVAVTATCRRPLETYQGLARLRLESVRRVARLVESTAFGDRRFLDLVASAGPFAVLCHHGAEVGDFRRAGFDPLAAAAANCRGADEVLDRFAAAGGRALLVTGSVFEAEEGGGVGLDSAIGAYGLSKTLSWGLLRHHAGRAGLVIGKLVVPHPFGAFEKPGLVRHLVESWLGGVRPLVRQPQLRRDFIHVDLLGTAYARLCRELAVGAGRTRMAPSLYRETVAEFARRLAVAMRPRLGRACELRLADPPEDCDEPPERFNAEPTPALVPGWPIERSWDRLAAHYLEAQPAAEARAP